METNKLKVSLQGVALAIQKLRERPTVAALGLKYYYGRAVTRALASKNCDKKVKQRVYSAYKHTYASLDKVLVPDPDTLDSWFTGLINTYEDRIASTDFQGEKGMSKAAAFDALGDTLVTTAIIQSFAIYKIRKQYAHVRLQRFILEHRPALLTKYAGFINPDYAQSNTPQVWGMWKNLTSIAGEEGTDVTQKIWDACLRDHATPNESIPTVSDSPNV